MLTRRSLLKWLGINTAVAVPAWLRSSRRRYELMTVGVAGFQYHDGMDAAVAATLREGGELVLRREPENPHDAKAVALHTPLGDKIGYLPRRRNAVPARLADQDATLRAVLTRFSPEAMPWERAEVRVAHEV